jgi:hypothetical protein
MKSETSNKYVHDCEIFLCVLSMQPESGVALFYWRPNFTICGVLRSLSMIPVAMKQVVQKCGIANAKPVVG